MKAVVMAGGEGTRLRPLTSNQPKPMVPIVGKPCMEHILELLRAARLRGRDRHARVPAAGDPQLLRRRRGARARASSTPSRSRRSARPARCASRARSSTTPFLVISGDALCDIDLDRARRLAPRAGRRGDDRPQVGREPARVRDRRHRRGRPRRALPREAVVGPGLLGHDQHRASTCSSRRCCGTSRTTGPYDFSKELFPLLLEMGRPIYGHVCDGYWQDIGNLDQYRQANFDALDGPRPARGRRASGCAGTSGSARASRSTTSTRSRAPPSSATTAASRPGATVGAVHRARQQRHPARGRARRRGRCSTRSTHIGRSALVEGAIVGRACDFRDHVRVHEGVAIGDNVTLGAESVVFPGVRIYPYKEVESGAQIHESLIWESRASSRLFGRDGVAGLVNVDLTPEVAVRLAAALGTALDRGARVVASRDPAPRLPDDQARDHHRADLDRRRRRRPARAAPSPVARHMLKMHGYDAGIHVGTSVVRPRGRPGPDSSSRRGSSCRRRSRSEIEKHFTRQELRRAALRRGRGHRLPRARPRELRAGPARRRSTSPAIRARGFRIVVDYGYSAASFVLPLVLGPLGVEAVSAHGFASMADPGQDGSRAGARRAGAAARVARSAPTSASCFDRAAERLYLVDETRPGGARSSRRCSSSCGCSSSDGHRGKLAVPGHDHEPRRHDRRRAARSRSCARPRRSPT